MRAVVPKSLQEQLVDETHRGVAGGHFSENRGFRTLARRWWWEGMYGDVLQQVKRCAECAVSVGRGWVATTSLHPIPVQRPFHIIGVDIMA